MHELPIKIQTIVYRRTSDGFEVLVLKRNPDDGGFWQTVTGTLEIGESILSSRSRELKEETGIIDAHFSEEIHRFSWQKKDYTVVELVYGAEVFSPDVVLSSEHTDFFWLPVQDAIAKVEKQNTKDSLQRFLDIIVLNADKHL